jgi:hypothetical protein
MFNDTINVREGNEQRKKTLMKVAQKLMANAGRATGLGNLGGVPGGGLGRTNAARGGLAARNIGQLARMHPQGNPGLGQGIGRFGMVDRMPGAFDPSIMPVPDLGGANGRDPQAATGGSMQQPEGSTPIWGGDPSGTDQRSLGDAQQSAAGGDPEAQQFVAGQTDVDPFPRSFSGGGNPQYVTWQGKTIPFNVYKALQASGELY